MLPLHHNWHFDLKTIRKGGNTHLLFPLYFYYHKPSYKFGRYSHWYQATHLQTVVGEFCIYLLHFALDFIWLLTFWLWLSLALAVRCTVWWHLYPKNVTKRLNTCFQYCKVFWTDMSLRQYLLPILAIIWTDFRIQFLRIDFLTNWWSDWRLSFH